MPASSPSLASARLSKPASFVRGQRSLSWFTQVLAYLALVGPVVSFGNELYRLPDDAETRWISFENPTGGQGLGGRENAGAKGHPSESFRPGETKVLLQFEGAGIINRIWLTLRPRIPATLRGIRLDITWDHAAEPAVSAPLGDFFGIGLGRRVPFENALFSDPEGRSFNCIVPMPFRKAALITLTNESAETLDLFYDVDLVTQKSLPEDALYFHCHWNHNLNTKLGDDFEILPQIHGRGRYLGCNLGVIADPIYGQSGWCEGEVKIFLDGDTTHPTLNGTGTEDYIGSGWGQNFFVNRYQGCPIADETNRQWAFYRYHIPDPVYFREGCRVTIQQMGGDEAQNVRNYLAHGARLTPVTVSDPQTGKLLKLLEMSDPPKLSDPNFPAGWTNFYRLDDYTATAYFYLNSPTNGLPPLPPVEQRLVGLTPATTAH